MTISQNSEYVNNNNCRDIAMKVGDIIEREYAKKFKIYGQKRMDKPSKENRIQ